MSSDGDRTHVDAGRSYKKGFWIVAAMLFVPLIVIVVLQFTSDENRYIGPDEARAIALDEAGLKEDPGNLKLTFDEDPRPSLGVDATWEVSNAHTGACRQLVEVILDATTGEPLLGGTCAD